MNEREYKRRIEAQRRVISQSELEQRKSLNHKEKKQESNSSTKTKPQKITPDTKTKLPKSQYGFFAVSVVGLAMSILALGFYLLFYVQMIGVTGNLYSSSGEIVQWIAQDAVSANSMATYLKYNFTEVELPPQVEELSVKIVNPWTLSVESIDKTPVGGFVSDSHYVYCDRDGIVLLDSMTPVEELPIIEGVVVGEFTLYEIVPIEDIEILKNALEVTSILGIEGISIDEISCGSGVGVNIVMGDITIKLGEDNYQEKIVQIPPILEEVGNQKGTLNLETYSSSNTTISFQKGVS